MKYTLAAIASVTIVCPALAQQPPTTLVLPTPLVERMAQQMQSMAAYMGGTAAREASATVAELQNTATHQPTDAKQTEAKPADGNPSVAPRSSVPPPSASP